jgi:hypothetical protein
MTRKDYDRLANAFRSAYEKANKDEAPGVDLALDEVAKALYEDNIRFNALRFRATVRKDKS